MKNSDEKNFWFQNSNLDDITLNAANWSGSEAPFSYSITNSSVKSSSLCDILFNPSVNKTVEALAAAKIAGYKQEDGKITLYAWGEKPNIDLSATLVIRGCL